VEEPLVLWIFYFGVAFLTVPEVVVDLAVVALVAVDSAVLVAEADLALAAVALEEVGKLLTRPKNFFPMPVSSLL
jgi:hypothetical protein